MARSITIYGRCASYRRFTSSTFYFHCNIFRTELNAINCCIFSLKTDAPDARMVYINTGSRSFCTVEHQKCKTRTLCTINYCIHKVHTYLYIIYNFIKIVIKFKYYLVNSKYLIHSLNFRQFCGQYNWTNVLG